MSFEKSLEKLTEIKDKLQDENISLDLAIKLYEESVGYTKECLEDLKSTDGKIVAIKTEIDKLIEKPLDVSEE